MKEVKYEKFIPKNKMKGLDELLDLKKEQKKITSKIFKSNRILFDCNNKTNIDLSCSLIEEKSVEIYILGDLTPEDQNEYTKLAKIEEQIREYITINTQIRKSLKCLNETIK